MLAAARTDHRAIVTHPLYHLRAHCRSSREVVAAMVGTMSFARLESVEHEIHAHYRALRAIRTRKALERSALWAEIGGEVRRVLDGVERGDRGPAPVPPGPAARVPVPPTAAVTAPGRRPVRAVA